MATNATISGAATFDEVIAARNVRIEAARQDIVDFWASTLEEPATKGNQS